MDRTSVLIRLLNKDIPRDSLRYQIAQPIPLEPRTDTKRQLQLWHDVAKYRALSAMELLVQLQHCLLAEFKQPYTDSEESKARAAEALADAKKKADVALAAIEG